jgi:hypothetical protein
MLGHTPSYRAHERHKGYIGATRGLGPSPSLAILRQKVWGMRGFARDGRGVHSTPVCGRGGLYCLSNPLECLQQGSGYWWMSS